MKKTIVKADYPLQFVNSIITEIQNGKDHGLTDNIH